MRALISFKIIMEGSARSELVVVLVDMDCFYVQVEQQLAPEMRNLPCAVVQYSSRRGGSILAVDYTARRYGVTRGMAGAEAMAKCPQLHLFKVPERRGKADLTRYRHVGAKIIQVLSRYCQQVERASVDEAFLELSDAVAIPWSAPPTAADLSGTVVAGWQVEPGAVKESAEENERPLVEWLKQEGRGREWKLAAAALLVKRIREAVRQETGCTCSAGIAHNKMLAKLAAGMNKPNGQTILPSSCVATVFATTPIQKVRHLGGKLGTELVQQLQICHIGQLCDVPIATLQSIFGSKTGSWLHALCRGRDEEPVRSRQLPQSLGCGKNFPGPAKLTTREQVRHWLGILASELVERLREDRRQNRRQARQLTVHFQPSSFDRIVSRACPLPDYEADGVVDAAWSAIEKHCITKQSALELMQLSLSASKFTTWSSQTLYSFLKDCGTQPTSEAGATTGTSDGQAWSRTRRDHGSDDCSLLKKQALDIATGDVDGIMDAGGDVTSTATPAEDFHSELSGAEYPNEVLEQCCECGENVPVWLVREHTDHHLAVRLQHKEGMATKPVVNNVRAPRASRVSTKMHMNTLDTFFTRK